MGVHRDQCSSDQAAWNQTSGECLYSIDIPIPIGDVRWGICATCGAFHAYHIDSDGVCTFMEVVVGLKWWIVPNLRVQDPKILADIDIFLRHGFNIDGSSSALWGLEAVLLGPGTRL